MIKMRPSRNVPTIIFIYFAGICILLPQTGNTWPIDSALARGDSCIINQWIPDSQNTNPAWYISYGEKCTGSDTVYLHCDFIPGKAYRGIPYSYGGCDPWALFKDRLTNNFLIGSHLCHYKSYGDPSDTITGIDCSAFLCHVWDIPRTNTTNLLSDPGLLKINITDIRTGDALVKASATYGYHAVFVAEADNPVEAVIWEASSSKFGCSERISDLNNPYWENFTALRNPELELSKIVDKSDLHSPDAYIEISQRSSTRLIVLSKTTNLLDCSLFTLAGKLLQTTSITPSNKAVFLLSENQIPPGVLLIRIKIRDTEHCLTKSFVLY